MNKYLCTLVGALFMLLLSVVGWWLHRAETKFDIVDQLQWKDFYLNGQVKAAPVVPPAGPPTK